MHKSKGLLAVALLALAPRAGAQALTDPQTEKKIDALLAQMTLEEKVGQLNQYSNPLDLTGPAPTAGAQKAAYDQIRGGLVGSMLNVYISPGPGAAINAAMVGNVTAGPNYFMTGASMIGTDLSNDHPVGIVYATSQATDNGLNPSATAIPANQPVSGTIATGMLISGNVECGSCHAVHGLPATFTQVGS